MSVLVSTPPTVVKRQKPWGVHMRNHNADFVHMRGQHHPLAVVCAGGRASARDQVAKPVGLHRIDQALQQAADDLADLLLLPAGAEHTAQLLN